MTRIRATELNEPQTPDEQVLQKAERKYYSCKSRVLDLVKTLKPQDPSSHEIANAILQELITLGLNYRFIRAGQAQGKSLLNQNH